MCGRSLLGQSVLAWLIWFAVPLCLPDVGWADEKADLRAAFAQGKALRQKGDYAAAAKAYEQALALASRVFGVEHQNTAGILSHLADVYGDMREYAHAEPLYQRSLRIYEAKLGADDPAVAVTLSHLAKLYQGMGQYASAEPLYQRSLKIHESQLGADHPDVASSLSHLANLYYSMGQYASAEPLYQRSLKIREAKFGPNHPLVATNLHNLANLYDEMGQSAKAESLYQRSLKIREAKLGPEHLDVAATLNNLAELYRRMGQYAQAEPLYQRSLKICASQLAPDHPNVATSLHNLANLYHNMSQYGRAEPLYRRSLEIWESKLGPDHLDVAASLNNLAELYQDMGQYPRAEPLLQRSLKIRESKLGPDHPLVAMSLSNLAILCSYVGQYARAEPLLQRSLRICESRLGPEHPDVATRLNNLATLYDGMGQLAQAEPLYQRSLKICESQLAPDHPHVATSLNNLAVLHAATERWSEAVAETDRQRRIVRRHVARTLPLLSEVEQMTFLQTQDETRLHRALSLGLNQRADSETAQRSAGWVLNGKAVAQEALAQRAILAAEGTDPTLADLVKQLLAVRRRLATLSLSVPKAGQEAVDRQQFRKLNEQEQELSRQLGQTTGRNTAGDPWVEPTAVRKALAKDALLIEIARYRLCNFKAKGKKESWSPPHYVAWLIPAEGQGAISIVDLGEAQKIENAVEATSKVLAKSETAILNRGEAEAEKLLHDAMRDLTKLVLEPLQAHFGNARQLIVSPDAALWLVPWGALPLAEGRYAIEKYTIHYLVSGRDLVSQATTKKQSLTDPVLFANPNYDLVPGEVDAATRAVLQNATPVEQLASTRGLGSLGSLPRVGRLPGTAEEAAAIKPSVTRYAGAEPTVYEDQFALEGVFKVVHRPRVVVLSTHGFFMPDEEAAHNDELMAGLAKEGSRGRAPLTTRGKPLENPLLRCGLLLAGCNQRVEDAPDGVDDGILTGMEIVGTDLRGTDLVVLSACETGLGEIRNGEGVAGLRQAFQLAGAKAVVSTLWQIPDQETVQLMTDFFANLAAGQSKADALRHAQLALIKGRRERNSAAHSYYWAAFTLTGNY